MNSIQKFFLGFALVAGMILYLASAVLSEPPVWASLFAKEDVTVTAATVQTRENTRPALPVIDVRDAAGATSLIQGYYWMSADDAAGVVAAYPVGETVKAPRWDGKLWRGLSGFGDWFFAIVSFIAAFAALFGLWMIVKLRKAD